VKKVLKLTALQIAILACSKTGVYCNKTTAGLLNSNSFVNHCSKTAFHKKGSLFFFPNLLECNFTAVVFHKTVRIQQFGSNITAILFHWD